MARYILIAFAILCAAVASQAPHYQQQYLQRLGGALDEIDRQIAALDARADAAGMERYPYIRRLMRNDDEIVRAEAEALVDMLGRRKRLATAKAAIESAPVYGQALQLVWRLDGEIARRAAAAFEPGLPLSLSGAFHAFVGFFLGLFAPLGLRTLLPRRRTVPA